MGFLRLLVAASFFYCLIVQISCIPTISIVGTKFYDSNFKQFFIKGVLYQTTTVKNLRSGDPLSNVAQCALDAPLMSQLGVNTVRVYNIDATADHSGCMSTFKYYGIYVVVGLDDIFWSDRGMATDWTTTDYNNYQLVMDEFQVYDNTLAFFAADGVGLMSEAAPYYKAAALDMKKYRDQKGYRDIPVGCGTVDDDRRPFVENYLACGSYGVDFVGLEAYPACDSRFSQSWSYNYTQLYDIFSGFNIPVFFSSTMCLLERDVRVSGGAVENNTLQFSNQPDIFGGKASNLWSGAIIFEWIQEEGGLNISDYGLVSYAPSGATTGTPTPKANFTRLARQWSTLTPTGTPMSNYKFTATRPSCPGFTGSYWEVSGDVPLSTLNRAVPVTRTPFVSTTSSSAGSLGSSTSTVLTGLPRLTSTPLDATANNRGLSTGAKAGIIVAIVLFFIIGAIVAFWFFRHRRKPPPLDPDGLEVGSPPIPPELDGKNISIVHEEEPEENLTPEQTGRNSHTSSLRLNTKISLPAVGTAMNESSSDPGIVAEVPTSELAGDSTVTTQAISQLKSTIRRREVASNSAISSGSWGTAPWESEISSSPYSETNASTIARAQAIPLLSDGSDELARIEAEERRIDEEIIEAERIRKLKEQKAALQAKKAGLMQVKNNASTS